jgi:hypothetical protein
MVYLLSELANTSIISCYKRPTFHLIYLLSELANTSIISCYKRPTFHLIYLLSELANTSIISCYKRPTFHLIYLLSELALFLDQNDPLNSTLYKLNFLILIENWNVFTKEELLGNLCLLYLFQGLKLLLLIVIENWNVFTKEELLGIFMCCLFYWLL